MIFSHVAFTMFVNKKNTNNPKIGNFLNYEMESFGIGLEKKMFNTGG